MRTFVAVLMVVAGAAWAPPAFAAGSLAPPKCGPDDRPLPELDGRIPPSERASGAWRTAYTCNTELVGQYKGEGASWQHAIYEDCAYYDTANKDAQRQKGTVVLDVRDPTKPAATDFLTTNAMLDPWESLKVNFARGLLAGVENGGPGFSVYDLKEDCRKPKLLGDIQTTETDSVGHAGDWAPDGRTYYGTTSGSGDLYAIDTSDPTKPKDFFRFTPPVAGVHDLGVSDDGTRAYIAGSGRAIAPDTPLDDTQNGLVIVDISDIQNRKPDPEPKLIGAVTWREGSVSQQAFPVRIGGKPYVIHFDELGSKGVGTPVSWTQACAEGLPVWGHTRIIDVADETQPKVVSKLLLEVQDPEHCHLAANDNQTAIFSYDSHYCEVDNRNDVKLIACGYFQSGLRVFDISDPANPRNVAYYVPPAVPPPAGSNFIGAEGDWAASKPWFKNGDEVWFTSQNNGFQVVRLKNGITYNAPDYDKPPVATPPGPRPCTSRRRFDIRLPRHARSARVTVRGKRMKVRRRGGRLIARVDLRGLRRGVARVRITGRTKAGKRFTATRTFRTCARKR